MGVTVSGRRWAEWALVAVATIGIGIVVVQSLTKQGVTFEMDRGAVVSITNGDLRAHVTLDDGAHKPHLSYRGESILEFSDWASRIRTKDDQRSLWEARFGVDVSEEHDEIIYTRSVPGYELSQVTKLSTDHMSVSYFIAPAGRDEIGPVELDIAHYRWYFDEIRTTDWGAELTYESMPETVWFRQSSGQPIEVQSDENGPHSFHTEYTLENVPTGERTLIAREEVWFTPPPSEN